MSTILRTTELVLSPTCSWNYSLCKPYGLLPSWLQIIKNQLIKEYTVYNACLNIVILVVLFSIIRHRSRVPKYQFIHILSLAINVLKC